LHDEHDRICREQLLEEAVLEIINFNELIVESSIGQAVRQDIDLSSGQFERG
jgi:hypothetical protein